MASEAIRTFTGRSVIYTSVPAALVDERTIPGIVNGAIPRHNQNSTEIEYLLRYYKGIQPIIDRVKLFREDVNNRLVINTAYSIVRNANGYFLGEPIKYTAKDESSRNAIADLNRMMDAEDKSFRDLEVGEWQSICGQAYRLVYVDPTAEMDDVPFEIPTLDPRSTTVIYSTDVGESPVMAYVVRGLLDDEGHAVGNRFYVYTKDYQYVYETTGEQISQENLKAKQPHLLGDIPIVEYPNNQWRLGDFETVIGLLDALNLLHSDRMNAVEQFVNAILVFVNCELKEASETEPSDLQKLKEQLAIQIKSTQGQTADVKYVTADLSQSEAEILAQTLIEYVYAVTGIPDRKQRSNGGGDTGEAVYLRDGWASLEVVARIKERAFRKSEKKMLRLVSRILNRFGLATFEIAQIDIHFPRNKSNDLLNKSNALMNLKNSQLLQPTDILTLTNLTDAPVEMAARGEAYWSKRVEEDAKRIQSLAKVNQPEISGNSDTET